MAVALTAILLRGATPLLAQTSADGPKWEVGVYAGGLWIAGTGDGVAALPPAGPILPGTERSTAPSRIVSSWFFGDGAYQVNQLLGATRSPLQITPLDTIAQRSLIDDGSGARLGIRVGRSLTRRWGVELDFVYGPGRIELRNGTEAAIEETRASYVTTWSGLLSSPFRATPTVAASATIEEGDLRQGLLSGAALFNLRTTGRTIPYVGIGAGLISTFGKAPVAKVDGQYQFQIGSATIGETDSVTIRSSADNAMAFVLAGGIKHDVSNRWGLRLDVRDFISRDMVTTVLDAKPAILQGPPNVGASSFIFSSGGSLVFSTTPGFSTLSGPAISGYRTFTGTGRQHHVNAAAGVFWRF